MAVVRIERRVCCKRKEGEWIFSSGVVVSAVSAWTRGTHQERHVDETRALQGYEKAWGPEHTSTLNTVNNLGNLYTSQGKLVEAEQMYQRALQGREKAWGLEHTSMLDKVNNLGLLYMNQGKLVKAEQMYQRALQGYKKAVGTDNISTYTPALNTIWAFSSLFEKQGNLLKARTMY